MVTPFIDSMPSLTQKFPGGLVSLAMTLGPRYRKAQESRDPKPTHPQYPQPRLNVDRR